MPNHVHLILSPGPSTTLERSLQLIKGGFSHRVGKELGLNREIWQQDPSTIAYATGRTTLNIGRTFTRILCALIWQIPQRCIRIRRRTLAFG